MRIKRPIGDPRALATSRAISHVYFVFDVLGREGAYRPTDIQRVLGELGMREGAARGALNRLREDGRLDAERHGRTVTYRLSEASLAVMREMSRRVTRMTRPWDGRFHGLLYAIPERERAYRDALRRLASVSGYGQLRPGLFISPWADELPLLTKAIEAAPRGGRVLRLIVDVADADARAVVEEAFELARLARSYRQQLGRMERWVDRASRRPLPGRTALRAMATTLEGIFRVVAVDPSLPDALLPDGWPLDELGRAYPRFEVAVGTPARGHLDLIVPGVRMPAARPGPS